MAEECCERVLQIFGEGGRVKAQDEMRFEN